MSKMKKSIFNWSSGKDSALCLYHCLRDSSIDIKYLVTTVNGANNRISMHGVRNELLRQQAKSIGIELKEILLPEFVPLTEYDKVMKKNLLEYQNEGIEYSVFGDIFLEDLKKYREDRLAEAGMKGVFPLWKRPTSELIKEFLELGFKAVIVCVNEKYLDKSFAGRIIDESFLADLPDDVDPCGENGEYHSFVFEGPVFKTPIKYELGELVFKDYKPDEKDSSGGNNNNHDTRFWYRDVLTVK